MAGVRFQVLRFGLLAALCLTACGKADPSEPPYFSAPDRLGPGDRQIPIGKIHVSTRARFCTFGFLSEDLAKVLKSHDRRFIPAVDFAGELERHGQSRNDSMQVSRSIITGNSSDDIVRKYCTDDGLNVMVTLLARIEGNRVVIDATARQRGNVALYPLDSAQVESEPLFLEGGESQAFLQSETYRSQLRNLLRVSGKILDDKFEWERGDR